MLGHIKTLILGNGVAQALQFLSILILSRIYLPSDFGLLAQVQSIAMMASIIGTLQLHLTIPLCKSDDEARDTAQSVQTITLALFALFFFPALYFGKIYAFSLVLALFLGLANTYNSYLVFNGKFDRLSGFYVARAVAVIGMQISFAMLSISDGLLWGMLIAEGLAALYLRLTQLGSLRNIRIVPRAAIALATRLKSFSVYGTMQELISVSAFYAPLILFTFKFDEATGGQYAMANRLVWAPVVLLSSSVAQVLYHRFGKVSPKSVTELLEILPSKLVFAAVLAACILSFYLQGVFLYTLGSQWGLASQLLPLQLLWGVFFLVSTPFRVVCRALHMQHYQLAIDAGMLALTGLLFTLTAMTPLHTMWGLVLIAFCQHALMIGVMWRKLTQIHTRGTA
jgi:O-antigen/teichoic acid export membrane protein